MPRDSNAPPRPWAADEYLASQINLRRPTNSREERQWFAACVKQQDWPQSLPAWMRFRIAHRTARSCLFMSGHFPDGFADHVGREYMKVFAVRLSRNLQIAFCCGAMAHAVQGAIPENAVVLDYYDWQYIYSYWTGMRIQVFNDDGATWGELYSEFVEEM